MTDWKEIRIWASFVLPPIIAIAVAWGVMTTKLEMIQKQQDRNTELILDILQKK